MFSFFLFYLEIGIFIVFKFKCCNFLMWVFLGRLEFNILIWYYLNLIIFMYLKIIGK